MTGTNPNERYVFVSHSSSDTWIAKKIALDIAACGAVPFLDEAEIDVGLDFEEAILTFLEKAHEFVVLLTPWSLERPYVLAELGAAWSRRIPIIVLLVGMSAAELQSRPSVPVFLKKRDLLPLNELDKYLSQLKRRVEAQQSATEGRPDA
jgi:hypothetical protein